MQNPDNADGQLARLEKGIRGLGMMPLPVVNGKDGDVDESTAKEIIDYAYNNGINYFDIAWG